MKTIDLSVIIPCFNSASFLKEAVLSALNAMNGILEGEVIIIDDGSTSSETEKILQELDGYEQVHIHQNSKNRGVAYTRNKGVKLSQGKWISFLDADDLWDTNSVRVRWTAAQSLPNSGWLASDYALLGYDGQSSTKGFFLEQALKHPLEFRLVEIAYNSTQPVIFESAFIDGWSSSVPAFTCTVMMRRETFLEIGGFDDSLRVAEDTHLWTRLSFPSRPFIFIPKICAFYRQDTGGLTSGKRHGYYQEPYLQSLISTPEFKEHRTELRTRLSSHWLMGAYEARQSKSWQIALFSASKSIRWKLNNPEAWKCLLASFFHHS